MLIQTFTNGDDCYPTTVPRTTHISFVCGLVSWDVHKPHAYRARLSVQDNTPVSFVQPRLDPCTYNFTVFTTLLCNGTLPQAPSDSGGSLSAGWVFIILCAVGFFLYCLAGFCVNVRQEQKRVGDSASMCELRFCPTRPCVELAGLVRDGCHWTLGCGCCRRTHRHERLNEMY